MHKSELNRTAVRRSLSHSGLQLPAQKPAVRYLFGDIDLALSHPRSTGFHRINVMNLYVRVKG